jgi:hypothetical protein
MLCWEVDVHMFSLPSQLFSPEQRNRMLFYSLGLTNQKSLQYDWANGQITSILLQTVQNESLSSGVTFHTF